MKTRIASARTPSEIAAAVASAVELLRAGEIVALPTETVYGLAADALDPEAALKIFAAKHRPRFDPLIVHVPDASWLDQLAMVDERERDLVQRLIAKFWPGPLTLVLPRNRIVPDVVTAGLETVALRMSAHPVFASILRELGKPLAAPSANRFGRISPTSAADVMEELLGRVPLIVDGGSTEHGLESTIVALDRGQIQIMRSGPITAEMLSEFGKVTDAPPAARPQAPGQLPSHYAPTTPVEVVADVGAYIPPAGKSVALLAWKKVEAPKKFADVRELSATQNCAEAAANLFRCLRELDRSGVDLIIAEALPEDGLGAAIMERLRRAASRPGASSGAPDKPG